MGENKTPWNKKDPRVVWRGKIKMAALRKELVRVSEGKRWSDIKPVVINNATDVHTKDVMNLRQFCGYGQMSYNRAQTWTNCRTGTSTLSRPKVPHIPAA
jgi:hypothetical protein